MAEPPVTAEFWPMRAVTRVAMGAARVSLVVGPRPLVLLMRRHFARNGRVWGTALLRRAPADVAVVRDEPYGERPDEVLDVYGPAGAPPGEARPTVVWAHGGAFVGGAKEEVAGYLRLLAAAGFTTVGVRYSRAPEARYPTPVRQVLAALDHLHRHAGHLGVDPDRFVLAGDSAGAHIAAQAATATTNPTAAAGLGVAPTIAPGQLRAVVLCCGVYDLGGFARHTPYGPLVDAVGWAYSGVRRYRADPAFAAATAVADHVGPAFPPTFLTVGNADPLAAQSHALAAALTERGVETDTLFFPADHEPALEHEYQFHFDRADAEVALDRLLAFLHRFAA